jgi:hypothetical protein
MTHLSAAQTTKSGASSNAMMHFEEGMTALQVAIRVAQLRAKLLLII